MLLLIFSLYSFASVTQRAANTPYEKRLEMIIEMANEFPGYRNFGNSRDKKLGAMGGIFFQTQWQLNTGREHLQTWNKINTMLSVFPYYFSKNLNCNTNKYALNDNTTLSLKDVCLAWTEYFEFAKVRRNPLTDPLKIRKKRQLRKLWHAHGVSIKYALMNFHNEMISDDSEEWYFWANWTSFVFLLEKLNFSTYPGIIKLIKKSLMPTCYPIDENACYYSQSFIKRKYVDIFTRRKISLKKLLDKTPMDRSIINDLL